MRAAMPAHRKRILMRGEGNASPAMSGLAMLRPLVMAACLLLLATMTTTVSSRQNNEAYAQGGIRVREP
jgi:hypothetical protein